MLYPDIQVNIEWIGIYPLMGMTGSILGYLLLVQSIVKNRLPTKRSLGIIAIFFASAAAGLLCANIGNWLLFPEVWRMPLPERFSAGMSLYFGLFGFLCTAGELLKAFGFDMRYWLNEIVPSLMITHAFGRVGCSLAGCCYGLAIPPVNVLGITLTRFPSREIEAVALFILFFIFYYKIKLNRVKWYLLIYSAARFFLEFGRGDNRGVLINDFLSPAQWISVGIWIFILLNVLKDRFKRETAALRLE